MTSLRSIVLSVLLVFSYVSVLAIDVSVTTLSYFQETPYIEIYSRILGNSVEVASTNGQDNQLDSKVEMLLIIKQGERIVIGEKYVIQSPSSATKSDFLDMKRYGLKNGEYELELTYVDLNNPSDSTSYSEAILINHSEHYLSSSDILLTKSVSAEEGAFPFNRSGFYYEPATFNLYGEKDSTFYFYLELYHLTGYDEGRYYKYAVREAESKEQVTKPGYKQLKTAEQCLILESFDITDLQSGNYELNVEVLNKSKEVLHQVTERFAVYHPLVDFKNSFDSDAQYETSFVHVLDEGELNYALKAIFPRVNNKMSGILNSIIWGDEVEPKRYFLYSFWSKFSPDKSKEVYDSYMNVARAVDLEFASSLGHGFETDRGYIFLKYGKPDDSVFVEDEPSAPPYEIWIYNYLEETQQTAVKFLFYNPSIVTNDFQLLHSTCRGERYNPQWEIELYKKDNLDNNSSQIDATSVGDNFNRNARRYFTDF